MDKVLCIQDIHNNVPQIQEPAQLLIMQINLHLEIAVLEEIIPHLMEETILHLMVEVVEEIKLQVIPSTFFKILK